MLGVVVIVFFLFQGFGDPARLMLGQRADAGTLNNIRKDLYLDQPKWKQFVYYLNDVSPISVYNRQEIQERNIHYFGMGGETKLVLKFPYLRRSYQTRKPVWSMLMEALPGTIILAFLAMFIATIFGMALGILAAVKKDSWMDTTAIFTSVLGISAPSFFMSIVIAYVFGFVLNQYTGLQMTGSLFDTDPFIGPPVATPECHPSRHYPGHPAHGHYCTTNPRLHAGYIEPGLYPDSICQRIIAKTGYLESCSSGMH